MKIKALALLVPALMMAGAVNAAEIINKDSNKVDLSGKIDARHTFSDNTGDDGDETNFTLDLKGETQITPDLIGFGGWEYKTYANDAESNHSQSYTRLAFAGLKFANLGSFDYGRNFGTMYDIEGWTDMLPVFGGDTYTWSDNYMIQRSNSLATYRNTDFFGMVDGWNFALQYQANNESGSNHQEGTKNGHNNIRFQNGDGFSMSTTFDFSNAIPEMEGFSIGAAFASSDRTNDQVLSRGNFNNYGNGKNGSVRAGGDKADAWTIGAKYDANNIYLAMMYAETRNMTPFGDDGIANKTQNFEAVAQYQTDFGLRPSLAWLYSKGVDVGVHHGNNGSYLTDQDLVNYIDVGVTYYFNKNMSTYVDYKINLLDSDSQFYEANGISTDDIVGVGLAYQF